MDPTKGKQTNAANSATSPEILEELIDQLKYGVLYQVSARYVSRYIFCIF